MSNYYNNIPIIQNITVDYGNIDTLDAKTVKTDNLFIDNDKSAENIITQSITLDTNKIEEIQLTSKSSYASNNDKIMSSGRINELLAGKFSTSNIIKNNASTSPSDTKIYSSLYVKNMLDNKIDDTELNNYYNKTETDNLLDDKVDNSTLNNYYNKNETDNLLNNKVNNSTLNNYYNKTETDNLLNNKVNNSTLNNYVQKNDTSQLTLNNSNSTITLNTLTASIIKGSNQQINFNNNLTIMKGDYRIGGSVSDNWYLRIYSNDNKGATIGVVGNTFTPKVVDFIGFVQNAIRFYFYNDASTILNLSSKSLNDEKYFEYHYGNSFIDLFTDKIKLSNLTFDNTTIVNSIISSNDTTTSNDTSIPTTKWVKDNIISTDLTNYVQKNDTSQLTLNNSNSTITLNTLTGQKIVSNHIQSSTNANNSLFFENNNAYFTYPLQVTDSSKTGLKTYSYLDGGVTGFGYLGIWRDSYYPHLSMNKTVTTMNKDVKFNGNITFDNTTNVNSIIPSTDTTTSNNTSIPTTLWTQKKFNDLNDLLQLTNLNVIQLLLNNRNVYIQQDNSRIYFSGNYDNSRKFYFCNFAQRVNFSGYGIKISTNGYLYICKNVIDLENNDLYALDLPNDDDYTTIKITRTPTDDNFVFYTHPVALRQPIYLPSITNLIPRPNLQNINITINLTFLNNSVETVIPYSFDYTGITTYIEGMNGENILNSNGQTSGFYFICHNKQLINNKYYTTLRCLYIHYNRTYSFTSNKGSVFLMKYTMGENRKMVTKAQVSIQGNQNIKYYNHSYTTANLNVSNDNGDIIVWGDFDLLCDQFYNKFTCLN